MYLSEEAFNNVIFSIVIVTISFATVLLGLVVFLSAIQKSPPSPRALFLTRLRLPLPPPTSPPQYRWGALRLRSALALLCASPSIIIFESAPRYIANTQLGAAAFYVGIITISSLTTMLWRLANTHPATAFLWHTTATAIGIEGVLLICIGHTAPTETRQSIIAGIMLLLGAFYIHISICDLRRFLIIKSGSHNQQ